MIGLDDLKQAIKEYNYQTLTDGDDSVASRCIQKAYVWVKAKLRRCIGVDFETDSDVIDEAVLKRALYELYSYAENESVAADKKEDANEILRAYFGDCISEESSKSNNPTPVVKIVKGRNSFEGF